jgi:hypothetical protein
MEAPPGKKGGFFVAVEPRKKKGGLRHMAQGTVRQFNEQKGPLKRARQSPTR